MMILYEFMFFLEMYDLTQTFFVPGYKSTFLIFELKKKPKSQKHIFS